MALVSPIRGDELGSVFFLYMCHVVLVAMMSHYLLLGPCADVLLSDILQVAISFIAFYAVM